MIVLVLACAMALDDYGDMKIFRDPELTPAQQEIKSITDEVLAMKPERFSLTYWDVATSVPPQEIHDRLQATAASALLLDEGESLSARQPNDYWPDLKLNASAETLKWVSMRAWGWEYEKVRINPEGPNVPPYDVLTFPGQTDWSRQLDICLGYANEQQTAHLTVSSSTSSMRAGQTPMLSRDVHAMAYAETGYEGHNQNLIQATEADIIAFGGICRYILQNKAA